MGETREIGMTGNGDGVSRTHSVERICNFGSAGRRTSEIKRCHMKVI